ncbi:MAG: hypothetical protein ACM3ML_31715 [Micromonosporaceae bacterium]
MRYEALVGAGRDEQPCGAAVERFVDGTLAEADEHARLLREKVGAPCREHPQLGNGERGLGLSEFSPSRVVLCETVQLRGEQAIVRRWAR